MKYLFIVLTVLFLSNELLAQKNKKLIFDSYNSIGFLTAKSPIGFTALTINGFKFDNWFVGLGFGIDDYYRKTLPLFAAVNREFNFGKSSLFIYANAGGQLNTKDKEERTFNKVLFSKAGFYSDAGLGYKIKIAKKNGIFFSIGNAVKTVWYTGVAYDFLGMPGVLDYGKKFKRIAFRMGYQF